MADDNCEPNKSKMRSKRPICDCFTIELVNTAEDAPCCSHERKRKRSPKRCIERRRPECRRKKKSYASRHSPESSESTVELHINVDLDPGDHSAGLNGTERRSTQTRRLPSRVPSPPRRRGLFPCLASQKCQCSTQSLNPAVNSNSSFHSTAASSYPATPDTSNYTTSASTSTSTYSPASTPYAVNPSSISRAATSRSRASPVRSSQFASRMNSSRNVVPRYIKGDEEPSYVRSPCYSTVQDDGNCSDECSDEEYDNYCSYVNGMGYDDDWVCFPTKPRLRGDSKAGANSYNRIVSWSTRQPSSLAAVSSQPQIPSQPMIPSQASRGRSIPAVSTSRSGSRRGPRRNGQWEDSSNNSSADEEVEMFDKKTGLGDNYKDVASYTKTPSTEIPWTSSSKSSLFSVKPGSFESSGKYLHVDGTNYPAMYSPIYNWTMMIVTFWIMLVVPLFIMQNYKPM